jgi:hypothetical protein
MGIPNLNPGPGETMDIQIDVRDEEPVAEEWEDHEEEDVQEDGQEYGQEYDEEEEK